MTKMKLLAATAAIAASLWGSNASATIYAFSVAENGGPTYSFSLDSTTGVSPGTKGLTTNFANVAYTTNGVASGTTSVQFNSNGIYTDPFFILVSGVTQFQIGSGSTVSFPTGTFSAIDPQTSPLVGNQYFDNVTLTVSTPGVGGTVPEPATWAMMVGGFGMIGAGLRRRSRSNTAVSFG